MHLGGNQIFGAIPSGIENLAHLISLRMENNLLKGTIPIQLMKLNKLQYVVLDGNKLSGKIPNPIGNLTQLYLLGLSRNNLHGSIPMSLGKCQHLQLLHLSDNNLNGTIPREFSDIPSLLELDIAMNNLIGFLPSDIGKLKNLFQLDISNNELSCEIPETLGTCVHLECLYMRGNLFHGSIPPSLGALREYGTGAKPSTYGDVYSYGILLLEMVTGKRPSDDMFKDDLSLHQFAKMALPESVMDIVDRRLLPEEIEIIRHNRNNNIVSSMMHECLVSLVKIGVSCSAESPKARKEMKDAVAELSKVRDFYLAATIARNV
ncbi:hypothetical protein MRB53_013293 [Persea americana]|uniref:Uncharacterized protein n=1 Tax=Persea americana TaxID=3435 RepID=A0ACC2K7Z3_PERAE|nr:hypothetical protein MRB53_013293 [Persea americana]